jgi:hypothetical protein
MRVTSITDVKRRSDRLRASGLMSAGYDGYGEHDPPARVTRTATMPLAPQQRRLNSVVTNIGRPEARPNRR